MKIKNYKIITALILCCTLILCNTASYSFAYGEVNIETATSTAEETAKLTNFETWQTSWQENDAHDTGKIVLTPGSIPTDLNFSWYSEKAGTPAVMISSDPSFSQSKIFYGTALPIQRSNATKFYTAANQVSITSYFKENTTYYYRYTDDFYSTAVDWSNTVTYATRATTNFSAILVGDTQIGASGNLSTDTYRWNQTLNQAIATAPKAAFLLSVGDQINYKTNDNSQRESEYAGFLYPAILRNLPIATAIGNHESMGSDYKYHFNNPNNDDNYGNTAAGCDYYFNYGDALFIVLNSNNRNVPEHRKLINKAIKEFPNTKWRIVMFHHDIYGSGATHSNLTSANMRILFAPLMDEFNVDLVFNGHDHCFTKSYSMLDGTAIDYKSNQLVNPVGTTYFTLGTSTGSKMYGLATEKQYYVAERSNNILPTYSILQIQGDKLTLKTYDDTGKPYADDFSIQKTEEKENPLSVIATAKTKKKVNFTKSTMKKLNRTLDSFEAVFQPTTTDTGAEQVIQYYGKTNDPLTYYGYAAGTTEALPNGFSTLLDKTRLSTVKITPEQLNTATTNVKTALSGLKKTTLTVKKGSKKLKNKSTIKIKKGKKVKLKIKKTPKKYKVTYSSAKKKYVTVNKKGVIRVLRKRKKPVKLTIRFQNRTFYLYVRTA